MKKRKKWKLRDIERTRERLREERRRKRKGTREKERERERGKETRRNHYTQAIHLSIVYALIYSFTHHPSIQSFIHPHF